MHDRGEWAEVLEELEEKLARAEIRNEWLDGAKLSEKDRMR